MPSRLALTLRLLPALPKLVSHRPGSRSTAADRFEACAARHPDRPFVLFEDRCVSYGQANALANRVAHWANGQGLGGGDVVALLMHNRPEYVAIWAGLAKLGVTTALLNTNLTGRALRHSLETARARHLVLGRECREGFASLGGALEPPLAVWTLSDPGSPEPPGAEPEASHDLDAALREQSSENPDPALRAELRAGDELFYIYTSGTTGLPKAARFSHMRFLSAGELNAFAMGLGPSDVYYCALPLYHTAGGVLVIGAVLAAGCSVALRRRFSASAFWDDVRRFDASCFQYIGEFCRYLVNQPESPRDRDHRVRVACGNGLRPDIWPRFQERFGIRDIREFYGATEGNAVIMNFENKQGSVGRMPFKAFTNARLVRYDVDADTHVRDGRGLCVECGPREVGEFVGRIPKSADTAQGRFEGYTSKEATENKILHDVFEPGDAWFRSGDLLRQDEQGFFYFVDRIGDTFRWKGENVSTQEVAEALSGHPDVELANVYGVAVPGHDGRAGMAALLLRPGAALDGAAFWRFVDAQLPRYAAPLFLRRLEDVEMTGTFKLRKVNLQHEGFDPEHVAESLFFRDDALGAYVPLGPELAAEIRSGARKL